jgi:hypothetical protein
MILTVRRQQQVLAAMRGSLRDSDPHLVGRFATFTRLTADEEMPGIERVRARPPAWLRTRARPGRPVRKPVCRPVRRLQVAVFIPVAAGLLLVVALLLVISGARTRCTGPRAAGQGAARAAAAPRSVPGRGGLACLFPCGRAHLLSPRGTVAGEMT